MLIIKQSSELYYQTLINSIVYFFTFKITYAYGIPAFFLNHIQIFIRSTKEIGGLAIAVCSDEDHNGSGVMDPFKQRQLLDAGADAAIPDFRDAIALVDYLTGS